MSALSNIPAEAWVIGLSWLAVILALNLRPTGLR